MMTKKLLYSILLTTLAFSLFAGIPGDANGDGNITIVDGLIIAQHSVGLPDIPIITGDSDVNRDGVINIVDALMVAQYVTGLIESFSLAPEVILTGSSSCKIAAADAISPLSSYEGNECMEYSYDPGTKILSMRHINADYNCCMDKIVSDSTVVENVISINEWVIEEVICDCYCLYDSDYEVSNILPEVYTIDILGSGGGATEPVTFTVDLGEEPVGVFCQPRSGYPW